MSNRRNISRVATAAIALVGATLAWDVASQPAQQQPRTRDAGSVAPATPTRETPTTSTPPDIAPAAPVIRDTSGALVRPDLLKVASCYGELSATDHGLNLSSVNNDARSKWSTLVTQTFGVDYRNWDKAQNARVECSHDGRVIGRTWTCKATAAPCQDDGTPGTPGTTPSSPACYPALSATGTDHKLQGYAEENGMNQWQHDAGNAYGTAYKSWSRALGQHVNCQHNNLGPLQRRWRCTYTGQPCK